MSSNQESPEQPLDISRNDSTNSKYQDCTSGFWRCLLSILSSNKTGKKQFTPEVQVAVVDQSNLKPELPRNKISNFEKKSLGLEIAGLAVQVAGLFGVVISLLFISKQVQDQSIATKSQTKALRSSTYQGILDKQLELDKIFIENPELRPYVFEKKEIKKSNSNYHKLISVADYQLDFFQMVWSQSEFLPEMQSSGLAWDSWAGYMKATFEYNSVLCSRLREVKGSYNRDFVEMIETEKWCKRG